MAWIKDGAIGWALLWLQPAICSSKLIEISFSWKKQIQVTAQNLQSVETLTAFVKRACSSLQRLPVTWNHPVFALSSQSCALQCPKSLRSLSLDFKFGTQALGLSSEIAFGANGQMNGWGWNADWKLKSATLPTSCNDFLSLCEFWILLSSVLLLQMPKLSQAVSVTYTSIMMLQVLHVTLTSSEIIPKFMIFIYIGCYSGASFWRPILVG